LREVQALISNERFSPGERLPAERELAEMLGVSRPMLREALNILESRGYIDRRSKSGNFVCTAIPASVRDPIEQAMNSSLLGFRDIVELRKVLELWAVEKASESPGHKYLQALEGCLKAMKATASFRTEEQFERYREADLRFHQVVAEMTSNLAYIHLFHFLAKLVKNSITMTRQLVHDSFGKENLGYHQAIYEAIRDRDSLRARLAMLNHFQILEKRLSPKRQVKGTKPE
jgi:GntR family transcriptional repressor for pyruvate dehydrogenase complex